eukprot:7798444-Karenia_brevis.AAC.1
MFACNQGSKPAWTRSTAPWPQTGNQGDDSPKAIVAPTARQHTRAPTARPTRITLLLSQGHAHKYACGEGNRPA